MPTPPGQSSSQPLPAKELGYFKKIVVGIYSENIVNIASLQKFSRETRGLGEISEEKKTNSILEKSE